MLAATRAVALIGLDPRPVRVEATTGQGLPGTRVVGLPDTAVREAAERVKTAVQVSGWKWPDNRVLINLSPAALRKVGAGFDLPMALAVLAAATDELEAESLTDTWAVGELGLDATIKPVPGILPIADAVRRFGGRRLVVPDQGAVEAGLIAGIEVVPVAHLKEAVAVLAGKEPARTPPPAPEPTEPIVSDLADVRGQPVARRAIEIAAAGGHHVLLVGPPGCGKSMLAQRLPGLLPRLALTDALEVAAIHSVAGARAPDEPLSLVPPFRSPHHTTSAAGLIGGGTGIARPGELSLAHRGVLFVDELLEVPRGILDALREPLESGVVTLTRSQAAVRYPARVLLVAASNPCPCGYLGTATGRPCRCRPDRVERYRARLSGPLLDRIDLQVELRPVPEARLAGPPDGEPTAIVAQRVGAARGVSAARWPAAGLNRDAGPAALRRTCRDGTVRRLAASVERLGLSARAFDRVLRVARTIADLGGSESITDEHVDEALAYRLPTPVAVG